MVLRVCFWEGKLTFTRSAFNRNTQIDEWVISQDWVLQDLFPLAAQNERHVTDLRLNFFYFIELLYKGNATLEVALMLATALVSFCDRINLECSIA